MFGKWYISICLHIDFKNGISAHIPTLVDLLLVQNRIKRYICAHIDFKNGISAHIPTLVDLLLVQNRIKRYICAHIDLKMVYQHIYQLLSYFLLISAVYQQIYQFSRKKV